MIYIFHYKNTSQYCVILFKFSSRVCTGSMKRKDSARCSQYLQNPRRCNNKSVWSPRPTYQRLYYIFSTLVIFQILNQTKGLKKSPEGYLLQCEDVFTFTCKIDCLFMWKSKAWNCLWLWRCIVFFSLWEAWGSFYCLKLPSCIIEMETPLSSISQLCYWKKTLISLMLIKA